jgi:DNA-binding response OmpR family regulator
MKRPLVGHVILVIEDEPLIAIDIQQTFEDAGARVILAPTVAAALVAIQEPDLSAAIVDHALGDGDSSEICDRLKQLNVPFVTYSGFPEVDGLCADAAHVPKPATPDMLLATVKGLLAGRPADN